MAKPKTVKKAPATAAAPLVTATPKTTTSKEQPRYVVQTYKQTDGKPSGVEYYVSSAPETGHAMTTKFSDAARIADLAPAQRIARALSQIRSAETTEIIELTGEVRGRIVQY